MAASRSGLVLKIAGSSLVTGLAFTGAFAFVLAVHCYANGMTMAPDVVLARNGAALGGSTALSALPWSAYWLWQQAPNSSGDMQGIYIGQDDGESRPFIPK